MENDIKIHSIIKTLQNQRNAAMDALVDALVEKDSHQSKFEQLSKKFSEIMEDYQKTKNNYQKTIERLNHVEEQLVLYEDLLKEHGLLTENNRLIKLEPMEDLKNENG